MVFADISSALVAKTGSALWRRRTDQPGEAFEMNIAHDARDLIDPLVITRRSLAAEALADWIRASGRARDRPGDRDRRHAGDDTPSALDARCKTFHSRY